jgi:DHA2 family multidrug resistance protein
LILPLFFQTMLGFTAFDTGMALLPGALATAVSMMVVGRLANRFDGRYAIAIGLLVFGWSTWMLGDLNAQAGYWDVFWPRLIQGFGLGALFVPLTTLSLADVPIHELASATGVFTLIRQLGGSFGIAILTTLIAHESAIAWNVLASGVTQTQGVSVGSLTGMVAQQSTMIAYTYVFRICAIVFVLAAPLVFFMHKPKGLDPAVSELALAGE